MTRRTLLHQLAATSLAGVLGGLLVSREVRQDPARDHRRHMTGSVSDEEWESTNAIWDPNGEIHLYAGNRCVTLRGSRRDDFAREYNSAFSRAEKVALVKSLVAPVNEAS